MRNFLISAGILVVAPFAARSVGAGLKAIADRLYRPPHGWAALALTWVAAAAGFRWAMVDQTAPVGLKVAAVIGLPAIALGGMFIARDQYRAARGLPPVSHHTPRSVTGITRWTLIVLGAAGLMTTASSLWFEHDWTRVLAVGTTSVAFLAIGLRRRITPWVGELIGAEPDPSTLD